MIQWLRTKVNPVPTQYDCLLLLSTGLVHIGRVLPGMVVVGWSVVNMPEWINPGPGHCHGENHPKAKLSDADCELIRQLCDPDDPKRLTYQATANKYECSKSTIRDIVKMRTRCG